MAYRVRSRMLRLLPALALTSASAAQTTTSSTDHTTSHATSTTSSPTTTSSDHTTGTYQLFNPSASSSYPPSSTPSSNDSAPTGNQSPPNPTNLYAYYFVFLALLLVCLGLAIFFVLRRRSRLRAARGIRNGQASALRRDLNGSGGWHGAAANGAATGRRRYRHGRWEDVGREEGLNEHGEAPPPYLPKRWSQEQQRSEGAAENEPAIPMETLSREDTGLKPPDYAEARTSETERDTRDTRDSVASGSSSRAGERLTGS